MTTVFADSFYFLALLNLQDESHDSAHRFSDDFSGKIVTTDWVLIEVGDALCGQLDRKKFLDLMDFLKGRSDVEVIPADRAQFDAGLRFYSERSDKEWSLTDCISFVIMQERNMTEALTGDHHFEQAGFRVLL